MKKIFSLLCIVWLTGMQQNVKAGELLGTEIFYDQIAPRVYVVSYKVFQDCSNQVIPPNKTIIVGSDNCAPTRNITTHLTSSKIVYGNPYCRQVGNSCNGSGLTNYRVIEYFGTITLSISEYQCAKVTFGVLECPGVQAGNIMSSSGCTYIEATDDPASYNIRSPHFYDFKLPFNQVNNPATVSLMAPPDDWQPDSMVYALKPISENKNQLATYTGSATFNNPFPTVSGIQLNQYTGMLSFTPNNYNTVVPPSGNSHAVLVEIKELRKINGVAAMVGTSQRLFTVNITSNNGNDNPAISNLLINGQAYIPNMVIPVQPNDSVQINFQTADPDVNDTVTIMEKIPVNNGTYYGNVISSGGKNPTGTILLKYVGFGQIVNLPVTIKDNACPVPNVVTQILSFRTAQSPTGIKENNLPTKAITFSAFPNPFSEEVSFMLNMKEKLNGQLVIYNILGREVDRIELENLPAGEQTVAWKKAAAMAPGSYVARLISGQNQGQSIKFLKLK